MELFNYLRNFGTHTYGILCYAIFCEKPSVLVVNNKHINARQTELNCNFSTNHLILIECELPSCENIPSYIYEMLDALHNKNCKFAWFMYDGAFIDCHNCFSDWHKKQIYALYNSQPYFSVLVDAQEIQSNDFQKKLPVVENLYFNLKSKLNSVDSQTE